MRCTDAIVAWLRRHRAPPSYSPSLPASAMESLGTPEKPPQGMLRKLGFHCRQLWRRTSAEFRAEWPLLKPRLWVIIPLLIFQYIHAIFTGMAYYMHTPLPEDNTTLHDLGFEVLPYLSVDAVSEIFVYGAFAGFLLWLLSPFVTRRKSFHAAVVLKRVLVVLVSCQVLRILTFLSTQLPAPAPHCRAPEPTSDVPWPVWWQVIIVNVARQASKGCGDLIFSSHITFVLTFCWTYAVMGHSLLLKAGAFLYAAATALCIIASRKHYTVDLTVAFYVIPLVFFHYYRHWTTLRDDVCTADNRSIVSLSQALPVSSSDMDASSAGGAAGAAGSRLGTNGGSNSRRSSSGKLGSSQQQAAQRDSAMESVGEAGGRKGTTAEDADAAVVIDIELAGRRASSASILDPASSAVGQAGSPMKSALSALADHFPGRLGGGGTARPSTSTGHRRTESQEPVLAYEDHSASSLG